RLFRAIKLQDRIENPHAVAPGVELADRSLGAGVIRRFDLGDRKRELKRMNAELGLDLETIGQYREGVDKAAGKYPVARKNILEGLAEHRRQKAGQEPVAGGMAEPIG